VFGGNGMADIPLPDARAGEAWLVIIPVLIGAAFGVVFRLLHHGADRVAHRIARPWLVTIIGTALFAGLAAAIPLVRFSGHHELLELPVMLAEGATGELWLLAAAKLLAMVLCLVAGWRGGEVFPLIFIGAAAGAGTALLLPAVDPAAAVAGAMAATLAVGWRRPLAALLVLVLVVDVSAVLPLVVGVGVGIALDRLVFPQPPADAH
jgi:H+/Cl- antiporter ClcA